MQQTDRDLKHGILGLGETFAESFALLSLALASSLGAHHVVTADGSLAAHFEHTFTLTTDGAWVLTALDGGEERLRSLGVPFGGR